MGWGLVAASREKILEGCTLLTGEPHKCSALVVDVCSEARRLGYGNKPRTARSVASQMCKNLMKRSTGLVVYMFDDSGRMHTARGDLHRRRYPDLTDEQLQQARDKGKICVGRRAFARGTEPYDDSKIDGLHTRSSVVWQRMWSSAKGKNRAFLLLSQAILEHYHQNGDVSRDEMIVWRTGDPEIWPPNNEELGDVAKSICNNTFGEADGKVCEAVKVLAPLRSMFVVTVDTDMILQFLCSRNAHMWGHGVWLRLLNETVNANNLVNKFGGCSFMERLSSAFWLMACNGVDYCRGLTRFGFNVAALSGSTSRVVFSEVSSTAVEFKVDVFVDSLLHVTPRRRRVKNRAWSEFVSEVADMLFCISLFSGADSQKEPAGGPDRIDIEEELEDQDFNESSLSAYLRRKKSQIVVAVGTL